MNFSSIIFAVVLALVSEPGICKKSDALVRSRLAQMSFGPAGAIQNGTERTLSTRTTSDLNSFVVSSIQSSSTLSQAYRQTLLSDYFDLLKRNGEMGELLKDLFGDYELRFLQLQSARDALLSQMEMLKSKVMAIRQIINRTNQSTAPTTSHRQSALLRSLLLLFQKNL